MLVGVFEDHEDELRADLQEYYGIDLERAMAGEHSASHIMVLTTQLPHTARLHKAYDKDAAWSLTDVLLASLLNQFRVFVWGLTPKNKRGPEPELIGPSYMTKRNKHSLPARVLSVSELLAELNKPRS